MRSLPWSAPPAAEKPPYRALRQDSGISARGKSPSAAMDISETDPEALLSLYSIVFQDVTLFNNTILENIRIGRKDATDEEVLAAARLANCDEFALRLPEGYRSMIGENGCELSGAGTAADLHRPCLLKRRSHHFAG